MVWFDDAVQRNHAICSLIDGWGNYRGWVIRDEKESGCVYETWVGPKFVGEYLQLSAAKNAVESNQHLLEGDNHVPR